MTKTKNGFDTIEEENFNILAKNAEQSNDLVGESSNYDDISNFHDRVKAFDSKFSHSSKNVDIKADPMLEKGGTIECIELFNFMCHDHLKVELKENINFIVGNNGSGKSAILTALTVCLGARASSTQRGNSLECLIKEGSLDARVIVTISNVGVLRFKGDLYGDSILIERRFKRGQNSFRTKSADGRKVISDKKEEVISICDNYNIQVDNPLSVLTQETAKKFLVNSTPRDLYDFFMKGTQLEQLSVDYSYALDRMTSMENSLRATTDAWPSMEEDIDNLRINLKALDERQQMIVKKKKLRAEVMWSDVTKHEEDAKTKEDQILNENESIRIKEENLSLINQKLASINDSINSENSALTNLYNSKKPLHSAITAVEKNISLKKDEIKDVEVTENEINAEVTRIRTEIIEIESKINEIKNDSNNDAQEKKEQILLLDTQLVEMNRQLKPLEEELSAIVNRTSDLDDSIDTARKILDGGKKSLDELSNELDRARESVKNKLLSYGRNIPAVLKQIYERASEFHHKPIGPIGLFIKLKDPQWSKPMDAIIGSHLKSFITHDHRDRQLLESILRSNNCENSVINVNPDPMDISDGEPDSQFLTALRALEIRDESVKKALIIFCSIERIVLIFSRGEAKSVMDSHHRNVDSVYTMTHRVNSTQNTLSFFAIYQSNKSNVFESSENLVKELSSKIASKTHEIKILNRDLEALESEKIHFLDRQKVVKSSILSLRKEISQIKSEIRGIEESLRSDDLVGITVFMNEKDSLESKLKNLKLQFGDCIQSRVDMTEQADSLKLELADKYKLLKLLDEDIESKKNLIISLNHEKRDSLTLKDSIQNEITLIRQKIETLSNQLKLARSVIEEVTKQAAEFGERITSNRSKLAIEKEIKYVESMIEKGDDFNAADFDLVKAEHDEKAATLRNSKVNVRINQNILDDMKIALQQRQRQWEDLRSGIARRSNADFAAGLQARDYRGYLDYDHRNRELNINVHIDQSDLNLAQRDIRQLSGGEKSFGTTCFLLSLWDAMDCPIRCLDEFDVYMDAVNRRLVVEMLINNAKNSKTQFILITPVGVRNFLDSSEHDNVHMVVLKDPERG